MLSNIENKVLTANVIEERDSKHRKVVEKELDTTYWKIRYKLYVYAGYMELTVTEVPLVHIKFNPLIKQYSCSTVLEDMLIVCGSNLEECIKEVCELYLEFIDFMDTDSEYLVKFF